MFDIFKKSKRINLLEKELVLIKLEQGITLAEKNKELKSEFDKIAELEAKLFSLQKTTNSTLNDKEIIDTLKKANKKLGSEVVELDDQKFALKIEIQGLQKTIVSERVKISKRAIELNKYKKKIDKMSKMLKLETFMTYIDKVAEGVQEDKKNKPKKELSKKNPAKFAPLKNSISAYIDKAINNQIKKNKNGNRKQV